MQEDQNSTSQRPSAALLSLDLEEGSQELLRRGAQYVKRLGLSLNILYVLPPARGQDEADLQKRIEELIVKVPEADDAGVFIRKGCIEDEILAYLNEESTELVILGHRHKAKRERVHVGSTVRTVISLAPAAVLVLLLDGKG